MFDALGFRFTVATPTEELAFLLDDLLVDMRTDMGAAGRDGHDSSTSITQDSAAAHAFEIRPVVDDPQSHASDDAASASHQDAGSPQRVALRLDDVIVHPTLAAGSTVSHLLMEVNRLAVDASWRRGKIPIHAAAVTGPSGTVLLAGASHSGKTSLAVALAVALGTVAPGETSSSFQLLADEVSALEPDAHTISPYGKPFALRAPATAILAPHVARLRRSPSRFEHDERFVPPSDLGTANAANPPGPVSMIVFPAVDPDHVGTRLTPVPPADALARLMALLLGDRSTATPTATTTATATATTTVTATVASTATATFRSLERLVRTTPAVELVHGDVIEAAKRLRAAAGP